MVGIVILIGLAVALLVLWCVIVAVGIVIPPPPIDQFVPRAEVDSDLVSSVPIQALQRAAKAMAGVRLVGSTDASLLLSVSPRLGSLDRGTGEWVLVTRGADCYRFGIRAKTALNLTSYSEAVVEFERELRMMLRRHGVVRFDLRESAASPQIRAPELGKPTGMPSAGPTSSQPAPPPPSNPSAGQDAPRTPPSSPSDQWWIT